MDYPDDYVDETAIASYLTYLDELPAVDAKQVQKDQVTRSINISLGKEARTAELI
jgi:hypothetical protein